MNLSPNVGEDDLHAVVDGQLTAERHREVMAYLAVYPDAADRVAAFFRQRVEMAALRESLIDSEPDPELTELEAALGRAVRRQHNVRRALGAGGLLVMLIAAASGLWFTVGHETSLTTQARAPGVEERITLAQDMLAQAELAATGPGDSAILWLQAHLGGRALKQPNLESLGLHFIGGSPLKRAKGPAIRLVYADEAGRRFNLFAGVKQSGVELAASLVPEGHIALSWQQDPLVFSLVAPQGSPELGEIMRSASDLLDPAPVAADAGLTQGSGAELGGAGGTGKAVDPLPGGHQDEPAAVRDGATAPPVPISKPL